MESSNIEEQTPEEKLVDELVGISMRIEGKVKEDAPVDKQREIKNVVKRAWVNGASCEEIENTYYEKLKIAIDSEKNVEQTDFFKKLSDFGTKTKEEVNEINFNFVNVDNIKNNVGTIRNNASNMKNNVLDWWKDKAIIEKVQETNGKSFNKMQNKKFKKLKKSKPETQKIEYESSSVQSSSDSGENGECGTKELGYETPSIKSSTDSAEEKHELERKKLVDKLVGLDSSFGDELSSLNILDIYKLSIKSTVHSVWKNGGSTDEIQKIYHDLVTKHLQDKEELEKQELIKKELEELKKESLLKKELKNEKLKFEGYMEEIKKDFSDNKNREFHCMALLEDNTIFIEKRKPIRKTFCGETNVLYLDILSAVYEKENPQYEYIQIYTEGFIFKLVNKNKDSNLKDFYDKLMEKINKEKISHLKNVKKEDDSSCSDADELMKWYELREKGVITQKEFENKKDELL